MILPEYAVSSSAKIGSRPSASDSHMNHHSPRLEEGKFFLETVWYTLATRIVQEAVTFYGLDEEQAQALRSVYLRPNNYPVELIR